MANKALDGIRVLDLTHHISGPYCTKLLADFGADVIKIECPKTGDPARNIKPFFQDEKNLEHSLTFLYLNTNKKSITVDLKSDLGLEIFTKLLLQSDILVENFSPHVMPSLGLTYKKLHGINPHLVQVSISNFGQTGPYRDYKASDIVEYALGGLMYLIGFNHREPLKHAFNQAQFKAGTNAASAALIALYEAKTTGVGQHVDVSIHESVASSLRDTTSLYTYMGAIRHRQPEDSGIIPERHPVKSKDGYTVPIQYGSVAWEIFANFLNKPELKDPRFETPESRTKNATELAEIIGEAFESREKLETFYAAHEHRGLIYGIVQSPGDILQNPQYLERGFFKEIDHPVTGKANYPNAPFIMSKTPKSDNNSAPTLGQHNKEIMLSILGYSSAQINHLCKLGVI